MKNSSRTKVPLVGNGWPDELQPELLLDRGEGGDEGLGGFGGEEGGAVGGVAEEFAEGAHDGEVVAGF